MAEIYALFSARNGKVRYVGETTRPRHVRFKEHQRCQIDKYITAEYTWIHREWKCGFPVECVRLGECSDEPKVRRALERKWSSKFPNLLNKLGYCYGGGEPPVITDIKDYMARFRFNCEGYRGIHWWRELDRYSVFFYTGHDWEWVPGDGAPGWTGDIWFSDLVEALKARDQYRQGRYRTWLPDIAM